MTKQQYLRKFECMNKTAVLPLLPLLAAGGKFIGGLILSGAVANAAGQAGKEVVDWWNKDDKAVATSLFNGKFDTLSDKQKQLLQKYKGEYNIDLNSAQSRNAAAKQIEDSIQKWKNRVGTGAELFSYASGGLLKAPIKAGMKKLLPRLVRGGAPIDTFLNTGKYVPNLFSRQAGKHIVKDMALNYGLWHVGLPYVLGIPQQKTQTVERTAADLPQDLTQFKPTENLEVRPSTEDDSFAARAGRVGDALLFGIPSFVSNLIKDRAVGAPREITQEDLAVAKSQLQEQGSKNITTAQIVARAKENLFSQKTIEKLQQVPQGDISAAKEQLSDYASKFQQLRNMRPEQREQALKELMGKGGQLSPRHVAAVAAALNDPQYRKKLFSGFYDKPQDLVQLVKDFKPLVSGLPNSTPAGTLLQDVLQGAITQDVALRYVQGLETADDKFGFVKEWLDAYKALSKETGASFEVKGITNKILWGQIMKNPLKLNKVLALKAYQADFNGVGDFLNNSTAFYGTLAAAVPLTVMLMSSLFNNQKSQQAPQYPVYPGQAQPPVQYSIANRGLMVG